MFLTVIEVAERLSICRAAAYQLVESGKLAHHRIGVGRGVIRASEEDLTAYLESCRRAPAEKPVTPLPVPVAVRLKHVRLRRDRLLQELGFLG